MKLEFGLRFLALCYFYRIKVKFLFVILQFVGDGIVTL